MRLIPCLALGMLATATLCCPSSVFAEEPQNLESAEGAEGAEAANEAVVDGSDPMAELFGLMRNLPELPKPTLRDIKPEVNPQAQELDPAISIVLGESVTLRGQSIFDSGPEDGLEVILCLQGGKTTRPLPGCQRAMTYWLKPPLI